MDTQDNHAEQTSDESAIEKTTKVATGVTVAPVSPQHLPRTVRRRHAISIVDDIFDPIHHSHLAAASEVMGIYGLDQVVFVPAAMRPFKVDRHVTSAEYRYLITVAVTTSNPRFAVSHVDVDRDGTIYTIGTLADLSRGYPDSDFYSITGADVLAQVVQWRGADKLFEQTYFTGVTRPGHNLSNPELSHEPVSLLEVPAMAIFSTDCRMRAEEGRPVQYLVPDGVVQYINKYDLHWSQSKGKREPSRRYHRTGEPDCSRRARPWQYQPGAC